ncbi:hypothetical protein CVT26_008261 [Gymnopilus dilepis]|uniref:Uncharacterized protein n=1 Tax=Gymnopilus dilepis TaxID=231916 RepID=A0A409X6W1_9AGAR|nr:hypothetical protein CVT26_008261 [Gymnopilus dilepis]
MRPSPAPSSLPSPIYSRSSEEPFESVDKPSGYTRRISPRLASGSGKSTVVGGVSAKALYQGAVRAGMDFSSMVDCLFDLYSIPARSTGLSHGGMDTNPIIMLSVYCNETKHSEAAVCVLEGLLDGLFRGKDQHLLRLSLPFTDLAEKQETKQLRTFHTLMEDFIRAQTNCRFILFLQTHADPVSGDLLYGPNKVTALETILERLLFSTTTGCTNSILLLNTCGGYMKQNRDQLPRIALNFGFKAIFGLTGQSVDPLLVSKIVFYNIIDLHVVGGESLKKVLKRCATAELLLHTSVIACIEGEVFSLVGASMRHRPNGVPIYCSSCKQPASFVSLTIDKKFARFRCRLPSHDTTSSPRNWKELLFLSDEMRDVGDQNGCRYIIARIDVNK